MIDFISGFFTWGTRKSRDEEFEEHIKRELDKLSSEEE